MPTPRRVKPIVADDGKIIIQNVKKILLDDDAVRNMPVAVCSILGPTRTGKSSFLNLMAQLLREQEDSNAKIARDQNLPDVFPWKGGRKPDTKGIHILDKPFIINTETFGKVALFLMDVVGIGDTRQVDENKLAKTLELSGLLSSLLIYNNKRLLHSTDIENAAMLGSISRHATESSKKLQKLQFVVRDFPDYDHGTATEQGRHLLQNALRSDVTGSDSTRLAGETITTLFETVECIPLSRPSNLKNQSAAKTTCSMNDFGTDMVKGVEALIAKHLSSSTLVPKQDSNASITCYQMYKLCEASQRNNSGEDQLPYAGLNEFREDDLKELVEKCYDAYYKAVEEKMLTSSLTPENISSIHEYSKRESMAMFCNGTVFDDSKSYKTQLEKQISEKFGEWQKKAAKERVKSWKQNIQKETTFLAGRVRKSGQADANNFNERLLALQTNAASTSDKETLRSVIETFSKTMEDACKAELERVKKNDMTMFTVVGATAGLIITAPLAVASGTGIAAAAATMAAEEIAAEVVASAVVVGGATGAAATLGRTVAFCKELFVKPVRVPLPPNNREGSETTDQTPTDDEVSSDETLLSDQNSTSASDPLEQLIFEPDDRVEISDKVKLLMDVD